MSPDDRTMLADGCEAVQGPQCEWAASAQASVNFIRFDSFKRS
jgi:hypothetical protein